MVSVVMPAYNAGRYIDAAIRSIRTQTLREWELIIVDDQSSDDTAELAQRHAEVDRRVRVIRAPKGGISQSLNRGIAASRYGWVAIMHADDVALPNRLQRQLEAAAADPTVVAWGCFAQHISSTGRVIGLSQTGPTSVAEFHRLRSAGDDVHMLHPTAFLRKEIIQAVGGYNPAFDGAEDFELFDRMACHGPIVVLAEPLMQYRVHAASVTMKRFAKIRRIADFVQARQRGRLRGQEISYEGFSRKYDGISSFGKLIRRIDQMSRLRYRLAGMAFGERQTFRACLNLAFASLLNPRYALPRVWNQLLSPTARQSRIGQSASTPPIPTVAALSPTAPQDCPNPRAA